MENIIKFWTIWYAFSSYKFNLKFLVFKKKLNEQARTSVLQLVINGGGAVPHLMGARAVRNEIAQSYLNLIFQPETLSLSAVSA